MFSHISTPVNPSEVSIKTEKQRKKMKKNKNVDYCRVFLEDYLKKIALKRI